jgi:cell fate regulator YaaT (PSP1 superfamily)
VNDTRDTNNIVSIRFKTASKIYDFESSGLELKAGNTVIVEVDKGLGMGVVVDTHSRRRPGNRKLKKVIRKADEVDMERAAFNSEREKTAFNICKEKIDRYKLPMKLVKVEYLFDSSKAIFYFTSETRIDFRELVKSLASKFHTRIEMRQIGVRDEAKMIGGLGPCGRMLCCAAFLSDFEPVTIKMAKEQNLALNPVKISGICGRLMCCLSYEYDAYKGRNQKNARKGSQKDGQKGEQKRHHHHNSKKDSCGGCPKETPPKRS